MHMLKQHYQVHPLFLILLLLIELFMRTPKDTKTHRYANKWYLWLYLKITNVVGQHSAMVNVTCTASVASSPCRPLPVFQCCTLPGDEATTSGGTPDDLHKTEAQYSEIQPQPQIQSDVVKSDTCSKQQSGSNG